MKQKSPEVNRGFYWEVTGITLCAGPTRLELATSGLTGRRSNQLNYDPKFLFFSGILLIILGYFIMVLGEVYSFQSLTLAPIILFIGYIVLIPSALIYKRGITKKD